MDYNGEIVKGSVEESGVLHLVLSRAPVNSAGESFFMEVGHYFEIAKHDPDVKAIVLSSTFPKYFSAGLDLKEAKLDKEGEDPARKAIRMRQHVLDWQEPISNIESCDKPVIVATAGIAYGLAVDICCAADIRYASSDTVFSIKEVDIGIAADIGTLSRLTKIIGNESLARELAYTARPFSAEEAVKMGFVSRTFASHEEVVQAALTTARIIASKSPVAVMGTKHLLNHARDHTTADSLSYTALWNAAMTQTEDVKQAFQAFLKKSKPRFSKL